jgi:alpha-tubulin suppressor-like RCC1 family protein
LGDGTNENLRSRPVQVQGLAKVVAVSGGLSHSLALRSDGSVWSWGGNFNGQLGDGTTAQRSLPAKISALGNVIAIAAGYDFSLAVTSDGRVFAWGNNSGGQLGLGTEVQSTPVPTAIPGLSGVRTVAASNRFALAVRQDGTLWAWGVQRSRSTR